jgi:hypothetical protein
MLLCWNTAPKQKTVHSSMAYYTYVLLYNAAKQMFHYMKAVISLRQSLNLLGQSVRVNK